MNTNLFCNDVVTSSSYYGCKLARLIEVGPFGSALLHDYDGDMRYADVCQLQAVAVVRVGYTGCAAWRLLNKTNNKKGELFSDPLGHWPTVALAEDELREKGFNPVFEDCLFGSLTRYQFIYYHGAGGAGAGRHLIPEHQWTSWK